MFITCSWPEANAFRSALGRAGLRLSQSKSRWFDDFHMSFDAKCHNAFLKFYESSPPPPHLRLDGFTGCHGSISTSLWASWERMCTACQRTTAPSSRCVSFKPCPRPCPSERSSRNRQVVVLCTLFLLQSSSPDNDAPPTGKPSWRGRTMADGGHGGPRCGHCPPRLGAPRGITRTRFAGILQRLGRRNPVANAVWWGQPEWESTGKSARRPRKSAGAIGGGFRRTGAGRAAAAARRYWRWRAAAGAEWPRGGGRRCGQCRQPSDARSSSSRRSPVGRRGGGGQGSSTGCAIEPSRKPKNQSAMIYSTFVVVLHSVCCSTEQQHDRRRDPPTNNNSSETTTRLPAGS